MIHYVDTSLDPRTMLSSIGLHIALRDRSGRLPPTRVRLPHASHGVAKGRCRIAAISIVA